MKLTLKGQLLAWVYSLQEDLGSDIHTFNQFILTLPYAIHKTFDKNCVAHCLVSMSYAFIRIATNKHTLFLSSDLFLDGPLEN